MEISNTSHPFYTGKMKLVDTAGRVDKFMSRYAKRYDKKKRCEVRPAPQSEENGLQRIAVRFFRPFSSGIRSPEKIFRTRYLFYPYICATGQPDRNQTERDMKKDIRSPYGDGSRRSGPRGLLRQRAAAAGRRGIPAAARFADDGHRRQGFAHQRRLRGHQRHLGEPRAHQIAREPDHRGQRSRKRPPPRRGDQQRHRGHRPPAAGEPRKDRLAATLGGAAAQSRPAHRRTGEDDRGA